MFVLDERDEILYAKGTEISDYEPVVFTTWHQLTLSFADFVLLYGYSSYEQARAKIAEGIRLYGISNNPILAWATSPQGIGAYYPTPGAEITTASEAIPEPAQRGRKVPMEWHKGQWCKRTKSGLVRCD